MKKKTTAVRFLELSLDKMRSNNHKFQPSFLYIYKFQKLCNFHVHGLFLEIVEITKMSVNYSVNRNQYVPAETLHINPDRSKYRLFFLIKVSL